MSYGSYSTWKTTTNEGSPDLSVVIPTYNESRRILPTIASICAHMSDQSMSWEIVVSDDGSTDGTPDMVQRLGFENLRVVTSGRNEGKGAAVRRGLLAAEGNAVLFTDADMSTPIDELDVMLRHLRGGADVVVGSRAAEGASESEKSPLRRLVSATLRLIIRVLLPTGVADTQCGFKLFSRSAARRLARMQSIDGFSFDLELLFCARRRRMRVVEHPVAWVDAPGSKVDPAREAIRFLRDIAVIRKRSLLGRYKRPQDFSGLHIGVVTPYPPSKRTLNEYGGHLVRALADKPEVDRVSVLHDDIPGARVDLPDKVDAVAAWRFDSPTSLFTLLREVRRLRPDAVLFNLQFASFGDRRVPAALGLFAPWAVRLCGTPSVVLLHNLVDTVDLKTAGFGENGTLLRALRAIGAVLTRVVLKANLVAVTIPLYADILQGRYRARNVYLAPHGVFPASVPAVEHIDSAAQQPQVLAFGKFGTYKRVEVLVEAYRLLLAAGYSLDTVIAGTDAANAPGYLQSVADANADLDGLRFTGYVAEEDVAGLFARATIVAFPYTATTGSSGPLHQAGAAGRAVVLPAIGDFAEVIGDEGYVAETFEPGDAMSMASAIARLLDDPDRRGEIGAQNLRAATALPIAEVADWHVLHLQSLVKP